MPTRLEWTAQQDRMILDMRAESPPRSWHAVARACGCGRTAAIDRARILGVQKLTAPPAPGVPMATQVKERADRGPLPPGHAASWGIITAGTVLDGASYPYPVLS